MYHSLQFSLAPEGVADLVLVRPYIMRTLLISTCLLIANAALLSTSRAEPFEKLSGGRIRHTISGFVFPSRIGPFERAQMQQYNQAGSDVSAAYNAGILIAATVYVYPAPRQEGADVLAREYASKRAEVLRGHQGVTVLSEGPVSVSQGGKNTPGSGRISPFETFSPAPNRT